MIECSAALTTMLYDATDAVVDGATSLALDSAEDREEFKRRLGDAIDAVMQEWRDLSE